MLSGMPRGQPTLKRREIEQLLPHLRDISQYQNKKLVSAQKKLLCVDVHYKQPAILFMLLLCGDAPVPKIRIRDWCRWSLNVYGKTPKLKIDTMLWILLL